NSAPDISDVERVEVLNGPQSVYFGRSTFSGAANYVTKNPGDKFAGRVNADVYNYNGRKVSGMIEVPIFGDKLTARLNARRYQYDGQYQNGIDHKPLGAQATTSATLALASKATQNLMLRFYYSYQYDHDGQPAMSGIHELGAKPTMNCQLGGTGGAYWCGALP